MKRRWLVLIALLLTFTLACSTFSSKSTEEPSPTTEAEDAQPNKQEDAGTAATPTSIPDDSTEGNSDPITLDPDALSGLNSYRMRMTWNFTDANNVTEQFTIEQEAIREPAAQRFVMSGDAEQNIEFVQVGETQWIRFGEEWIQTSGSGDAMDEFGGTFVQPEDMLSSLEETDYEDLGKETINGIKTRHLRVDSQYWATLGTLSIGDIEKGVADIWIADESDLPKFPVRFEMEMEGTIEENKTGTLVMAWEVYDINEPFIIEPPAEAENIGLPPEIPLCSGSSEVTAMGSLIIFTCEDNVKDVNAFYADQLTGAGWEQTQSTEMEGMATSGWKKGDETLQLTITPDDSGSGSDVMIALGE